MEALKEPKELLWEVKALRETQNQTPKFPVCLYNLFYSQSLLLQIRLAILGKEDGHVSGHKI